MPLVKNKVGRSVLAWTPTAGQAGSDTCVISAHGGYGWITTRKRLQNVTLHFYCEHGYVLKVDPSLSNFISGKYDIRQTVAPGTKVQDYSLGKYENTDAGGKQHNSGGWTYSKVQAVPETMSNAETDYQQKADNQQAGLDAINTRLAQMYANPNFRLDLLIQDPAGWQAVLESACLRLNSEKEVKRLQEMADRFGRKMDIITIRSRSFHSEPTLSEVISDLHDAGYNYTTVHCFFCRSNMASPFKQPIQIPYKNY